MIAATQPILPKNIYWFLFSLLAIAYIIGLFVPLMNNDSAHHANIALHMYLTGDYVSLVDRGKDYLDKPHLLFWLSAASFELLGVTSFAYKLPSFLFTILSTYSTYRLGKALYNNEVGKLAALVIASAFAYILANNDVRMDAILTAAAAFATWQLAEWVNNKKILFAIGGALGLALGFATKGWIGVVTPVIGIFFYILYKRELKLFFHWHLLIILISFLVFISPVLYAYYVQFDLHPEKNIRGKTGWSGIKFILWQQVFERYEGSGFGKASDKDYFFFFHSFLWAFATWSILTYVALFTRLKSFFTGKNEWLTISSILVMALVISFSGFKLPHYLNITFPMAAVLCASLIVQESGSGKSIKIFLFIQIIVSILCFLAAGVVTIWAFPLKNAVVIIGFVLMVLAGIFIFKQLKTTAQKLIGTSVVSTALIFYLLNANFYPQLLKYQSGGELAKETKGKIDPKNVYYWPELYNHSYTFYTKELKKNFSDSVLQQEAPVWVMADKYSYPALKEKYRIIEEVSHFNYNVSILSFEFLNPSTRQSKLNTVYLVRIK